MAYKIFIHLTNLGKTSPVNLKLCSILTIILLSYSQVIFINGAGSNLLQHLANYDFASSSSSFGEPFFRLEPPSVINFANTQGATIVCLASGSPRPTISWYSITSNAGIASSANLSPSSASSPTSEFYNNEAENDLSRYQHIRPVNNVTNLLQIVHNGAALRLLPFKESNFREEIHSTEYKCLASNQLATIQSKSVLVQAGKLLKNYFLYLKF